MNQSTTNLFAAVGEPSLFNAFQFEITIVKVTSCNFSCISRDRKGVAINMSLHSVADTGFIVCNCFRKRFSPAESTSFVQFRYWLFTTRCDNGRNCFLFVAFTRQGVRLQLRHLGLALLCLFCMRTISVCTVG